MAFVLTFTINPLTTIVPDYIETSQLICIVNQSTGFYMMGNVVKPKWNEFIIMIIIIIIMDTYPLKESIPKRLRLNFVHELYADINR